MDKNKVDFSIEINNNRKLRLSGVGENWCAVAARLGGGSQPANLAGRFKDVGYRL